MVRFLIKALLILSPLATQATQLDTFGESAEPTYVQAIAPRFTKWIIDNFETSQSPQRLKWKQLLIQESSQLTKWSFSLDHGFSWPRLQFGMQFTKGNRKDSYVYLFPQDSAQTLKQIQQFFPLTENLKANWLGFGISLQTDELFVFNRETDPSFIKKIKELHPEIKGEQLIRKTVHTNGKWQKSIYLAETEPPKQSIPVFAPLVNAWRVWYDSEGKFVQYELGLEKFNLRVLDDAAIDTARKVNSEFLLSNLRILYRSMDDYDVLYP